MPEQQHPEVGEVTKEFQARLDELMAPLHFHDLLTMAEDVCLTRKPDYADEPNPTGESAIVARVGTRGLKAALELQQGRARQYDDSVGDDDFPDEQQRPITLDSPIRMPDRFSESVDFSILAQAKAFGSELMTESFHTLGQDAYAKVDAFKHATSKDEQLAVMQWLDQRLYQMTRSTTNTPQDESGDSVDPTFYHPARLSPKLIGAYPNQQLDLTCLSVSLTAAEFFRRAGADVMHANVSRRGIEQTQFATAAYIASLEASLKETFGLDLAPQLSNSLRHVFAQTWKAVTRDESHHAAVYVRLLDNNWAQFDSNFASTVAIEYEDVNEELSKSYAAITDLAPFAPGIELSHELLGVKSAADIAIELLSGEEPLSLAPVMTAAYAELLQEDTESIGQRIFDMCITPYFTSTSDDTRRDTLKELISSYTTTASMQGAIEQGLQAEFYKLFEKYVLWGDSPEVVVKRAQTDSNYLLNRVTDIATLPFTLMATLASRESKQDGYFEPHSMVELGLPEQRIGLAVLSDFAAYTDSPLTSSFWMSHWPGHVSVVEGIRGAAHSEHQDAHIYNNLVYRGAHPLTSLKNHDIIHRFLDPRQQNEDETHGKDTHEES